MMRGGVLEGVRNRNTYRLIAACMDLISLRMAWEATMYLRVMLNPVMHFQLTARQVERLAPPLTAMLTIWLGVTLLINTRREHDESVGMHLFRVLETWSFACTLLTALTFVWRRMGEEGYLGANAPAHYGGSEAGFLYNVIVIEELAWVRAHPLLTLLHSDIVMP